MLFFGQNENYLAHFVSVSRLVLCTTCYFQKFFEVSKSYMLFPKVTRRRHCVPHDVPKSYSSEALYTVWSSQKLLAGGAAYRMSFLKVTRRRRCVPHVISKSYFWKHQIIFDVSESYLSFPKVTCRSKKLFEVSKSHLSFPKATWFSQKLLDVPKSYLSFLKVTCRSQKLFDVSKSYLSFPKVTCRSQKLSDVSKSYLMFPKVTWCF